MNVTYQMVSLDIHPENEGTYIIVSVVTGSFLATLKFDGVDWMAIPRTPAMWLRQIPSLAGHTYRDKEIDELKDKYGLKCMEVDGLKEQVEAYKLESDNFRNIIKLLKEEMARKAQLASRDMQEYIWEITKLEGIIQENARIASLVDKDLTEAKERLKELERPEDDIYDAVAQYRKDHPTVTDTNGQKGSQC